MHRQKSGGAQWRLYGWIPRGVRDPHPGSTMGPQCQLAQLGNLFSYGNDDIKVTKFGFAVDQAELTKEAIVWGMNRPE